MNSDQTGRLPLKMGRGIMTALAILLCLAAAGKAQKPNAMSPQARQKLEALRVWRLTQELNLSEDQSAQFFPRLKTLRELRQQYRQNRSDLLSDLSDVVRQAPLDRTKTRLLVDSLAALDEGFHGSEATIRRELNDVLTIEQQARFILFQANFDKEMRRMIEQIRRDRNPPGQPR